MREKEEDTRLGVRQRTLNLPQQDQVQADKEVIDLTVEN